MILYVVAAGVSHTGGLDWYMSKMLGRPKILCVAQLRLMIPVGIASAFFNNTPLVAIMIPIVQSWAKKINMSDSQLLMHLSFASILGGTITIIGTSTNLVVAGLLGNDILTNSQMKLPWNCLTWQSMACQLCSWALRT